ncbi:sigma-70 family RNA polymerase sigma factor [Actinomadura sp. LD22]|uniref:Sigma-70 family RNA polymerase sigma factor n=1 Tax=Actinomadura physcomitrii TaxID=2650748 RepID=A0A6I4MNX0_9ACTN|nr:RNA polymerase sigma factor [Actinomadura physcomitrii]MWA05141.1 sigma-70 family RNA polymerase sigma factor [Actinomadura physcomitrii]
MTAEVGESPTDLDIATGFQRDPERFTDVHDRYFRDVYRYVAGRLDVHTAEDIAAETFCLAFGKRDRFDPERGSLRAWLFGIATNLVAQHRRKEARRYRAMARSAVDAPAAGSHEDRVVTETAAVRMRPQLAKALASLSAGERDVVLLVALAELSYDEVADALGIPQGTVGSRLSRARKKLHDAIRPEAFHG